MIFSKLYGKHGFVVSVATLLLVFVFIIVSGESRNSKHNSRIKKAQTFLTDQLKLRASKTTPSENAQASASTRIHKLLMAKKSKTKSSLQNIMERKTPGEPVLEFIPKKKNREQFTLASSGGGGRAFISLLAEIRGYGGIKKVAEDTHMITTNSGSSWALNRLLLEGTDGPLSSSRNPKALYEELVNQLAGKYDGEKYDDERALDQEVIEKRQNIIDYVESTLKLFTLTPQFTMYLNYFTSTLSGKIQPEWHDFCKVRAVCDRKGQRGHEHECYEKEPAQQERIKTVWRQQIALDTSGSFLKKNNQLYQYNILCGDANVDETPNQIPMYLNVDTRDSNSRASDKVTVDIPYLSFKRCELTITRMTKTKRETVQDIFTNVGVVKNEHMATCTINGYEENSNAFQQTIKLSGASITNSLRKHYEKIWKEKPGRMSTASAAFGAILGNRKLIDGVILKMLQKKGNGIYQLPNQDHSFEYLMIVKKIVMAAFNAFGTMAQEEFDLKRAFMNIPTPQGGYNANVDLSRFGVAKELEFAFALADGGYIDNFGLSSAVYNLQRSEIDSEIVVISHTSTNIEPIENREPNMDTPAERFEKIFATTRPEDENIVDIILPVRKCNENKTSQYRACGFSTQIFSDKFERVVHDGEDSIFAKNNFRTYKLTTKENKYFGIKAGSKYTVHFYNPVPKVMESIGMLPPGMTAIEDARKNGKWTNGNNSYTFPDGFDGYDGFMYLAHSIEKREMLKKFLKADHRGKNSHFMRFQSKKDGINNDNNNERLKGRSKMKKEETIQLVNNMKNRKLNADTMRFKDMSSTMNPNMMCEIVWKLGYKLMNEKFLGNFSKMKKTKLDKRITKKHDIGAICEGQTHPKEYYSKLWGSMYAELIRHLPVDAELPFPDNLPFPPAMIKKIIVSCADYLGEKFAGLDLDYYT